MEEDLLGYCGKNSVPCVVWQAASFFPTTVTKCQVKRRMKAGWVQAEDLFVIIVFLENIVINSLESPWNLAENLLENPGIKFHFTVDHPEGAFYEYLPCEIYTGVHTFFQEPPPWCTFSYAFLGTPSPFRACNRTAHLIISSI